MTTRTAKTVPSLYLIAGIIVFATMTLAVWQISQSIRDGEPLTMADARLSSWLHTHHTPPMTTAMFAITALGSTQVVSLVAAAFGIYFISRRRFYWLAAFISTVFGGMLLNRLLKYAFHRPRPFLDNPLLTLTGYSFPSGHTMMATVLSGVVAAYFFANTKDWRQRIPIILSATLVTALVGFSRIYLGAHYLSDVLGAMAEGLAWLSLSLTVVYSVWQWRTHLQRL
jgi:membrane-associated phospholipid phosphatase